MRWTLLFAMLLSLPGPSFANSKTEAVAYCLGQTESDVRVKDQAASAFAKIKGGDAASMQMRGFANSDVQTAASLKNVLKRLGAMDKSGQLRSPEALQRDSGFRLSQICYADQFKPCMQQCYARGEYSDETQAWKCQQVCHLPPTCKPQAGCEQFNNQS